MCRRLIRQSDASQNHKQTRSHPRQQTQRESSNHRHPLEQDFLTCEAQVINRATLIETVTVTLFCSPTIFRRRS